MSGQALTIGDLAVTDKGAGEVAMPTPAEAQVLEASGELADRVFKVVHSALDRAREGMTTLTARNPETGDMLNRILDKMMPGLGIPRHRIMVRVVEPRPA